MTTPAATSASTSVRVDESNFNVWMNAIPRAVNYEDSMAEDRVAALWVKLYAEAKIATASEEKKRSFRLWMYAQGCLNGTSRVGNYSVQGKLADGTVVDASVIPRVLGREIRKFYRGNMEESYNALKSTAIMQTYPRFIAHVAAHGINAADAFATADWMDACPLFTPTEAIAHETMYTRSLTRARIARDNKTLERVEDERAITGVKAGGQDVGDRGHMTTSEF